MLIAIPVLVFLITSLHILGRQSRRADPFVDWRGAFLQAAILWGGLVVVISESLSLVKAIGRPWVAVLWLIALAGILFLGIRGKTLTSGWRTFRQSGRPSGFLEWTLLLGMGGVILALLLVALVSPPNSVDSLLYHMTRVVQWAQNQDLRHYATEYEGQLLKPIWSEAAILHLRILWGSDRPANLVSWFSMLGSVVGVGWIAALLGVRRPGQWVASAFALSIPSGVLQSTSTYNDYVSGFWVVCLAYLIVLGKKRVLTKSELFCLGLATGLGMLTKGHFLIYALPLLAWHLLPRLLKRELRRTLVEGVMLVLIPAAVNLGFWARNIGTYGGPYGPPAATASVLAFRRWFVQDDVSPTPTPADGTSSASSTVGQPSGATPWLEPFRWWLVRLAQAAGRNLVSPTGAAHRLLMAVLGRFPSLFDKEYIAWADIAAWSQEDTAGNPVHLLLVPLSLIAMIFLRRPTPARLPWAYGGIALTTYAFLPVVITYGTDPFVARYQIPFFLIWAPIAGAASELPRAGWLARLAAILLVFFSLPWVLMNNQRPLIGRPPWPTKIESILVAPQEDVLFAVSLPLKDHYTLPIARLRSSGCKEVGLVHHQTFFEYPVWWLLEAPQSGTRIQVLSVPAHLERYRDPAFAPCAVLCTLCDDEWFGNLRRIEMDSSLTLYLAPSFLGE